MALLMAAFTTGLILLPGSLLNCIFAPIIGRLFDKYGPRAIITPGTILVVIGYALIFTIRYRCSSMDDCRDPYYYDARCRCSTCFYTNKYIKLFTTRVLSRWYRDYSNNPTSSRCDWYCGYVALLSAKQDSYLTSENELTEATASGSSFVFTIGLVLAMLTLYCHYL